VQSNMSVGLDIWISKLHGREDMQDSITDSSNIDCGSVAVVWL
jgi:hypothetical protein